METYISVPLATLGIGLLLSIVALFLITRASEKVRPAIWGFVIFAIVVNGAGCYCLLSSPGIGTLITVWFFGLLATGIAVYPLLRPYLVHGLHSEYPFIENCVIVVWPLAALGAYALYIVASSYRFGPKEKTADEVAPTTWEDVREKGKTEAADVIPNKKEEKSEEEESEKPTPGKYPKKKEVGERW
jgi:hypothetical protein